ncbi:DUF6612 family protein [Chloroflexota bacterium]
MKKLLLLYLVLLISALVGCGGGESTPAPVENLTAEEIIEAVLTAADDIETCHYDMDMSIDILVTNGESVEMLIPISMTGISNEVIKEMWVETKMTLDLPEEEGGKFDIDAETYIFDGIVYMKMVIPQMGEIWAKQDMPQGYWDQTDQLTGEIELLRSVQVELLGYEQVGGADSYVLEVWPDLSRLWENMMQQTSVEDLLGEEFSAFNLREMMQDISMKLWVAKGTFFPVRSEIEMNLVINSETIDADYNMMMNIKNNNNYYNYNQSINIKLPAEAENAVEMSFLE